MELRNEHLYIGGEWVWPSSGRVIAPVNPSTEEVLGSVPEGLEADIDAAVEAARRTFDEPDGWAAWEPKRRAEVMERFAEQLEARAGRIAELVSSRNGMPISIARQLEAGYPTAVLRYYAGLARTTAFSETRAGLLSGSIEGAGPRSGSSPRSCPGTTPRCLHVQDRTGHGRGLRGGTQACPGGAAPLVPDRRGGRRSAGVLNIVPGGREAGGRLVSHPGVDKVAFAGSPAAGRAIAEVCGRLLRPVALELGGKSAGIVLDDARLDPAQADRTWSPPR
ncbi:hypothetical protein GCM10027075_27140 [Streptomyces heilongjiangensis]